jgi:hypothetical protein
VLDGQTAEPAVTSKICPEQLCPVPGAHGVLEPF